MDKMKGSKQPFFLYHATRGCHFDNYPSDEWAGKSEARTVYSDCIVEMDYVLDQLVKKLEETGELENTMILLTSDNGAECEIPPHARSPWRGCKGSSWEGGVRVPTFVYWKGMINPRRDDGLFDFADILPTALSLAGFPGAKLADFYPKTTYIDGVDQASWFVANDGHSARRSRPYTVGTAIKICRVFRRGGVFFGRWFWGCAQQLKAKRQKSGASAIGQEAEVTDTHEALRKDVE
jgi:arylsulfatase